MNLIRKNILTIVSGLIALLAVGASFWPVGGLFSGLQEQVSARAADYQAINGLVTKQRTLPIVDPNSTEPVPLEVFPTAAVIERAREATSALQGEATKVMQVARSASDRPQLVSGALPAPTSSVPLLNFQREYTKLMTALLSPDPQVRAQSIAVRMLQAGLPPSEIEIERVRQERRVALERERIRPGVAVNTQQVQEEINQILAAIADDIRTKAAQSIKIYINPDSLSVLQAAVGSGAAPDPSTVFYAQLGLWIQQAALEGIAAANAGSRNVLESPIKHLVKITIPDDPFVSAPPSGDGSAGGGGDPNQMVAAAGLTGRVSNALFDVVQFEMVLNVDSTRVPEALTALSSGRLLTITEVNFAAVDAGAALASGCVYGDNPVVQLTLRCELLMFRDWLLTVMPERVQQARGLVAMPSPDGG